MTSRPRLLLFDPFVGGHHADHLEWIGRAWHEKEMPGDLVIAASGALFERHPGVRHLASDGDRGRVRLLDLPGAETFERPLSLIESALRHRSMIDHVVEREQPERLFAMYLDHAQLALMLRRRSATRFSGLLFRPEAHLPRPASGAARLRRMRKAALFRMMAATPSTQAVFTLDPTAVEALQRLSLRTPVHAVPDPVPGESPADGDVRERYGVDPGRALWVLPGALGRRKGVLAVTEAVTCLAPAEQRVLCVVFAGSPVAGEEALVSAAIDKAEAETEAQIVWDRRFLPSAELQALVAQADGVLAPYVGHVGSSGIVMRVAGAGRPLIATDEGLIGRQVRENRLGQAVPPNDVRALADALRVGLRTPERGFDPTSAAAFARSHTPDAYVEAILGPLGLSPSQAP